jgi:hypothetical protein
LPTTLYNFTENARITPAEPSTEVRRKYLEIRKESLQLGITLQEVVVGNKSVENLAEREGFEPSVQVLARTTV